ncbi:MAG: hypothetical protein KDA78_15345 [Planctomycetaceae bacterium]|nr:hypothetical protein [Planctomycetaceae bacterium]
MNSHEDNHSHDRATSDGSSPSFGVAIGWIGGSFFLVVFYLFVGPWIVLLLCVSNDAFMDTSHPLGKALELSLYPATLLAGHFELYNSYLFWVFLSLGG